MVIQPFGQMLEDFYPRPPRGGRPKISPNRTSPRKFLSTPSARRATPIRAMPLLVVIISIHALREEGDKYMTRLYVDERISIHALREEGDHLEHLH